MLQEAQRTEAPSAFSVSISTAVWIVMCSEPETRAPLSGCFAAYSSRIAIRPGISVSAIRISLRPQSASLRSATLKSPAAVRASTVVDMATLLVGPGSATKAKGARNRSVGLRAPLSKLSLAPLQRRGRSAPQLTVIVAGRLRLAQADVAAATAPADRIRPLAG